MLTVWRKLVTIWKRLKELFVGRPKVIKIGDGEVILKNLTAEKSAEIQAFLLSDKPIPVGSVVEIKADEPIKTITPEELTEFAVGLYLDKPTGEYRVVTVKYNPNSKVAMIVNERNAGSFRLAGVNALKVELSNLDIV
jgi:hypothetical protein